MTSIPWKSYAFEFFSIFIAVISAFALNNWNDNRNNRLAENKILTEIYNGLEKDLSDIHLNKLGHEMGLRSTAFFRDATMNRSIDQDSVTFHYFNLTRDFISLQNTSGYETLKSKGLEIVKNDSLRAQIISIYEHEYNALRKFEEEYFELQFQENYFNEINKYIAPSFIFDTMHVIKGIDLPMNLSQKDKNIFLSYLWKIDVNRKFMLHYYSEVETKIYDLKTQLDHQIR